MSAGTIGIGGPSFNIVNTPGPDGDNFYPNTEADVEFNRGVNACVSFVTSGNLITGMTHEIGHTLGFRHSDQTRANNPGVLCATDASLECDSATAVMKAVIVNGISGVLSSWDQNAVRSTYPCSLGGGCGVKADFNGDSKSDVIWRKSTTGEDALWQMNGVTINAPVLLPQISDTNWKMAGVGDFDGDGKDDILWRNPATWVNAIWRSGNGSLPMTVASNSDQGARVWVGDFNGDRHADLLWAYTNGEYRIWLRPDATLGQQNKPVGADWRVVSTGDFDGNGTTDVVWRNIKTGQDQIWRSASSYVPRAVSTVTDFNWVVTR